MQQPRGTSLPWQWSSCSFPTLIVPAYSEDWCYVTPRILLRPRKAHFTLPNTQAAKFNKQRYTRRATYFQQQPFVLTNLRHSKVRSVLFSPGNSSIVPNRSKKWDVLPHNPCNERHSSHGTSPHADRCVVGQLGSTLRGYSNSAVQNGTALFSYSISLSNVQYFCRRCAQAHPILYFNELLNCGMCKTQPSIPSTTRPIPLSLRSNRVTHLVQCSISAHTKHSLSFCTSSCHWTSPYLSPTPLEPYFCRQAMHYLHILKKKLYRMWS